MMNSNPYNAYKQQSVMTMTQGDMLNTLYDALIKQFSVAKIADSKKDYTEVNRSLQKAQSILSYLQGTLDFNYEISNNLSSLYDYFNHVAVQANVKKDMSSIDEVVTMIGELRDAYSQADKQLRRSETAG